MNPTLFCRQTAGVLALGALLTACGNGQPEVSQPRQVLFVGMDISGSFQKGPHAQDAKDFLARYLHARLNSLGGLERPHSLFVGPIGGVKPGEPKSFHPMQAFEGKDVDGIRATLEEIFPADKYNPNTDYNAFLGRVGDILRDRNLALKPVAVVMVTDGKLDVRGAKGKKGYAGIDVRTLERFSRNVTLRLLYTDPDAASAWRQKVPRRRVKVWTQDAEVMARWKDPGVLKPEVAPQDQADFLRWVKENVDFSVRARRVG